MISRKEVLVKAAGLEIKISNDHKVTEIIADLKISSVLKVTETIADLKMGDVRHSRVTEVVVDGLKRQMEDKDAQGVPWGSVETFVLHPPAVFLMPVSQDVLSGVTINNVLYYFADYKCY